MPVWGSQKFWLIRLTHENGSVTNGLNVENEQIKWLVVYPIAVQPVLA